MEIQCKRSYLPPDLRIDPAYAVDSDRWLTYSRIKTDPRRKAGFLGDRDYPFGHLRRLDALLHLIKDSNCPLLWIPRRTPRSPTTMKRPRTTTTNWQTAMEEG
jgi:hypothetical protein